jgi:hypothetical protein
MEKDYLILKRAAVSRLSGQWNDDDFDVLAERIFVAQRARVTELAAHYKLPAMYCYFACLIDDAHAGLFY